MFESPKRIGEITSLLAEAIRAPDQTGYIAAQLRRWQQAGIIVASDQVGSGASRANCFSSDEVFRARMLMALTPLKFDIPLLKQVVQDQNTARTSLPNKKSLGFSADFQNVLKICLKNFDQHAASKSEIVADQIREKDWFFQLTVFRSRGDGNSEPTLSGAFYRRDEEGRPDPLDPETHAISDEFAIESVVQIPCWHIWYPLYQAINEAE